jgi:hypothetical protein
METNSSALGVQPVPEWLRLIVDVLSFEIKLVRDTSVALKVEVFTKSSTAVFDMITITETSNVHNNIYSTFIGRGKVTKRPVAENMIFQLSFDDADPDRSKVFLAETLLYAKRFLGFDAAEADRMIQAIVWSEDSDHAE